MGYDDLIGQMWIDVWGNTLIGAIAILGAFAFLCYKKNYDSGKSSAVMFPVLFGVILEGALPMWVKGLFLCAVGILWGLAILRITGVR